MSTLSEYEKHSFPKEWGYSLSLSFLIHSIIFCLVWFASSVSPSKSPFKAVYSVHLVDMPLAGTPPAGKSSDGTGSVPVEKSGTTERHGPTATAPAKSGASRKEIKLSKKAPANKPQPDSEKVLHALYEGKLKSLALQRKAAEEAQAKKEEHIKSSLGKLKEQVSAEASTKLAMERRKAAVLGKIRNDLGQGDSSQIKGALSGIREKITREGGIGGGKNAPGGQGSVSAEALYTKQMQQKILNRWGVPSYLRKRKDLEAVVVIRLSKSGQIENLVIKKRSGDVYIDESAMRAVRASSPFAPVPPEIEDRTFELKFNPSDKNT